MNTIRLTDEQLALTRHALRAYLQAFGHREADTVEQIKDTLAAFAAARDDGRAEHHGADRPHPASA